MDNPETNPKYQLTSKLLITNGRVIPLNKILAFEQRLYESTIDELRQHEEWKQSSLEKSITYVI